MGTTTGEFLHGQHAMIHRSSSGCVKRMRRSTIGQRANKGGSDATMATSSAIVVAAHCADRNAGLAGAAALRRGAAFAREAGKTGTPANVITNPPRQWGTHLPRPRCHRRSGLTACLETATLCLHRADNRTDGIAIMSHGAIRTPQFAILGGLLGNLLMAAGPDAAAAGAPPETAPRVLLAQAQPSPQPPQNVEATISSLRQQLQITPAQEAQFSAVAGVMRDNARAEGSAPQQPSANTTAVDDLRAYIRYGELELGGLKKMLPALEALYSVLSPAQKKAADAIFRQGPGG
jgi:protein CpxP